MLSRPFRFLAVLSSALLLSACGGDGGTDGPDDSGRLTRTTLRAGDGQYWGSPRFSPDGSRIAFRLAPPGDLHQVAVMKADGTDVRVLADNGTYLTSLAWSPDGSRLYYSGDEGIFSIPASGGTPTLESDTFAAAGIDVSPDGRWLAYGTNGGGVSLLDLTSQASERLLDEAFAPAFSPDGTRLAYVGSPGFDDDEIRVFTLATKQSVVLADDGSYLSSVDWLPDGRLAALSGEGITLFDLAGATPQGRLVRDEFAAKELDVSPDGKKMVYAINGRTDLYVLTGF